MKIPAVRLVSVTVGLALASFAFAAPLADAPIGSIPIPPSGGVPPGSPPPPPPPNNCPGGGPPGNGGGPPGSIYPDAISQYSVWSGAINYNVGYGKIFKDQVHSDISTLLTFTYPPASAGLTCTFNLGKNYQTHTGSNQFDVFSSLYPATSSTTGWPPGNGRNNQLARMTIIPGGLATYLSGFPQTAASFPCPAPGTVAGWELVPTGDLTDIEWAQTASNGAFITYK